MRAFRVLATAVLFASLNAVLLPTPVVAATATATMAVTATVLSFCTVAALPMAFGNYSSADLDASALMTVVCTTTTPFSVGLSVGGGSGATVASRKMTNGLNTLNYSLYTDAGRTTNWGNTVGSDALSGVGTGLVQTLTVYGRIPGGQYVGPGLYSDVVLATITY